MKQILLFNQFPHIRGLCLKNKGIVLSLLMLFAILFSSEKVSAQSGTVTFTTTDYAIISNVMLHDGDYSSTDIAGIQLDIFGVTSSINAANRISSGHTFQYVSNVALGASYGYGVILSQTQDKIIVIASNDGSEFSFKSIYINEYMNENSNTLTRFEGFKDGVSTGYVDFGPSSSPILEDLLTSTFFPTDKFGNIDEIRITNQTGGNMINGVWIGINAITIGAPVIAPTVSGISPAIGSKTGGTSVSITGTNFNNVTSVKFGSANATSFTVNSATSITATSPSGSGTADITVTTTSGTSATSAADQFSYITLGVWNGNVDSDWTNANNWSGGVVPNSSIDVTIPSEALISPTIFPTKTAECNNFTSADGYLEIRSDLSGTGSLIVHGTASGMILSRVYLTAAQWHVVAPPAKGFDISIFMPSNINNISKKVNGATTTYAITDYNEGSNAWNSYFTNNTPGTFESGKGYLMRRDDAESVRFFGDITTGNKTITLTKTGTEGWNCIGNPYTSAIGMNSSAASTENFLTKNSSSLDENYACAYLWDPASSTYKILGNLPSGLGGARQLAQNYVQVGQGFFVKAKDASQTATFTQAMQSHQNKANAPLLKSAKASWPTIELNIANGNITASAIIAFNSNMTKGLDPTYDAGLLRGTTGVNLYSRLVDDNGVDFAVQALPSAEENLVIPIGVESKVGGSITFSAKTVELPANTNVVLEDKITGTLTSLTDGGVYTATVEAGVKGIGRFYLHTKSANTTTDITTDEAATVSAYASNKTIYINGKLAGATALLFDINGKQVDAKQLSSTSVTLDENKLVNGVYVLRVISVGKVYSFKVVLQ